MTSRRAAAALAAGIALVAGAAGATDLVDTYRAAQQADPDLAVARALELSGRLLGEPRRLVQARVALAAGVQRHAHLHADHRGRGRAAGGAEVAVARELPGVRFAKVDTDASPAASARLGIRGIPTLVLFDGGREVARQSGAMAAGALVQWIRSHAPAGAAR